MHMNPLFVERMDGHMDTINITIYLESELQILYRIVVVYNFYKSKYK